MAQPLDRPARVSGEGGMNYQTMEHFAAMLGLIDDHARAWQAVGQSESGPFHDPGLKYKKQEALEATKALKDAMRALQDEAAK